MAHRRIAPDFDLLDVYRLPTPGGPDDFVRLLEAMRSVDVTRSSPVAHALFAARWALGRRLGWDGPVGEFDSHVASLRTRLPDDLVESVPCDVATGRFAPLYVTEDEAALEIVNRTMHGVLHLGWVPDEFGEYRGQLAVLVKRNGLLGAAYLAAIAPLRHLVVYPAMLRAIKRAWHDHDEVTVRQIDPPPDLCELATLPRIDYADAFVVRTAASSDRTAEQWATAVLAQAPAPVQARLSWGWAALGLKRTTSDRAIAGWEVLRRSADTVLLGRQSRIGMPGELLFTRQGEGFVFATFVHHRTAASRPVWAAVKAGHVHAVRTLLEGAAHRPQGVAGAGAVGGAAGSAGAGTAGAGRAGGGSAAGSPGPIGTLGPGA